MHELTEAGMTAMAGELLRLASDGQRSWDQATPELRQEFRGFIDSLVDKAHDAEAERVSSEQASPRKGVLP
jgi:hypothetical protein